MAPVLDVPLISVLEVFELVCLAGLTACTVWLVRRSLPATLETRQKRIETVVADFGAQLAAIGDERALWKVQGERLAEEVETYLGQIERKRSSIAASASRIDRAPAAGQAVKPSDLSRADQLAWARSQN